MRKPVCGADQVRHKPICTTSEDGKRLEIIGFRNKECLYFLCSKKKGTDQPQAYRPAGYHAADLHLCFCICKEQVFS